MLNKKLHELNSSNGSSLEKVFKFNWCLNTDLMQWDMPIHENFAQHIPLNTGAFFMNLLSPQQFWSRFVQINQQVMPYTALFSVLMPTQQKCLVQEKAQLTKHDGKSFLKGTIKILDPHYIHPDNEDAFGYDQQTGLPTQQVLVENMISIFENKRHRIMPGACVYVALENLNEIFFSHGIEKLTGLLNSITHQLRANVRFNDMIGRLSGSCFGIVMRDIDEWGVHEVSARIQKVIDQMLLKLGETEIKPKLIMGKALFDHKSNLIDTLQDAQNSLFGMKVFHQHNNTLDQLPQLNQKVQPHRSANVGYRRFTD